MKLMKRLFEMNNKGMSLVELICAVAILGLAVAALGGAMVISAQHYQRDSAEFEVQQEAQTATNLIGNLVVDAAKVTWDNGTKTLTIIDDAATYVIKQEGDKLKYTQGADSGILAEGVADDGFKVNTAAFENNKNVNISLTLKEEGKEITANYNATARNGKLSTTEQTEKAAYISVEDEMVIEPYQVYRTKISVLGGMSATEYGGLSIANVPSGWRCEIDGDYLEIEAPQNAQSAFAFTVQTVNNKPNTSTPYAQKEVNVKVRRVTGITLNHTSGAGFTAASEYVFSAAVLAQNVNKGYGKSYDTGAYEYKNPRFIDFQVTTGGGLEPNNLEIDYHEDVDNPYVTVKLKANMTANQSFTVKAVAKHPEEKVDGVNYNKAMRMYDHIESLPITIECPGFQLPPPPLPDFASGIERGQDYVWGVSGTSLDSFATALRNKYTIKDNKGVVTYQPDIKFKWYVRFKKDTDLTWPIYHIAKESGSTQKLSGVGESRIMLPDKAYNIQFFVLYTDEKDPNNKKILWPNDESLFTDGGFGAAGLNYSKGWNDADATSTTFDQYGKQYDLPATELVYYDNVYNYNDNFLGMPSDGTPVNTVATTLSIAAMNGRDLDLYYQTFHLHEGQSENVGAGVSGRYLLKPVFWKKEGGSWADKTPEYIIDNVLKFEYQQGGSTLFLKLKEIGKNVDAAEAIGEYRVGFELQGVSTEYKNNSNVNDGSTDYSIGNWNLFKEGSDDGFFYFEITN